MSNVGPRSLRGHLLRIFLYGKTRSRPSLKGDVWTSTVAVGCKPMVRELFLLAALKLRDLEFGGVALFS